MHSRMGALATVVVGLVGGLAPPGLLAETFPLELKRMSESPAGRERIDRTFHGVSSQHFWADSGSHYADLFREAVKKEPAYTSDRPFKGVAELGGKKFGFAIDSDDLATKGYHRLYFDFNGNRDLSDEKPVEADGSAADRGWSIDRVFFPLEVRLTLDGKPFDYPFWMNSSARVRDGDNYASAALLPAAYRAGSVTLDGKTFQVAVIDYNSNGRFNDEFRIPSNVRMSDDRVWAEQGDIIIVEGKSRAGEYYWEVTTSDSRQYLSKLVNIEGRYYDVTVTSNGDRLTLTPSKLAVGSVRNGNERFRAVLYGELGMVKISGGKGSAVAVPQGDWKLLSCCIESGEAEPRSRPAGEADGAKDPDDRSSGREEESVPSRVIARGKSDYQTIKVRGNQVVDLPFGPPYKPVVALERRSESTVRLGMLLVGTGGEVCSDLRVGDTRPSEPSFVIATPDGEIVERGKFEYG